MPEVLLGVFDGYMSLKRNGLTSETKIGGTPTYLPLLSNSQISMINEWTTCKVCGNQMFLLLQAFSPLSNVSSSHHRMIYVFCCNSAICTRQPSSSWCAFTLQVDNADENLSNNNNDDQSEDCIQMNPLLKSELPPNTFPPCYIDIIPEPKKEIVIPTDIEAEIIKAAEENSKNPDISENDIRELEETIDLKDKTSDYDFEKFRKKMAKEPSQVIRYYVKDKKEKGEKNYTLEIAPPIFMNPKKIKESVRIPPCSNCGSALIHEIQIMPTSVYFLHVTDYVISKKPINDEGVDWGTITIFVCSKECSKNSQGIVLRKEFVLFEKAPELEDEVIESDGRKDLRTLMMETE